MKHPHLPRPGPLTPLISIYGHIAVEWRRAWCREPPTCCSICGDGLRIWPGDQVAHQAGCPDGVLCDYCVARFGEWEQENIHDDFRESHYGARPDDED